MEDISKRGGPQKRSALRLVGHEGVSEEEVDKDGEGKATKRRVSFEEDSMMNEGGCLDVEDETPTHRRVSFEEDSTMNIGAQFENEGGIPPPDDPFWSRLLSIPDAISKAMFYLKKTIDVTRRCGHGPITPEEEDAYKKIVPWAVMFLKRFHFHIINEKGESRFCDEYGLIRQREIGTCPESLF